MLIIPTFTRTGKYKVMKNTEITLELLKMSKVDGSMDTSSIKENVTKVKRAYFNILGDVTTETIHLE